MRYKVSEIVEAIRVILDQNMNSESLVTINDVDTLSLEEIIASKVSDAARVVSLSAPLQMLDGGKPFGDTIGWDMNVGYGSGHTVLPDDFLRLIVFQMSDWSRPVTEPITERDPSYAMQRSRIPGLRGTPQNPVVAIVNQPIGNVLEFYSCTQGENVYVKMARYQPIPTIEVITNEQLVDEDWLDISQKLKRPIEYYAAYLVAVSLKDTEQAAALLGVCNSLLGL